MSGAEVLPSMGQRTSEPPWASSGFVLEARVVRPLPFFLFACNPEIQSLTLAVTA